MMHPIFNKPAIIFCATQRSGSTMIVDDFQNVTGRDFSQTEAFFHLVINQGVDSWSQAMDILTAHRADEAIFFDKIMFPFVLTLSSLITRETASNNKDLYAKILEKSLPRGMLKRAGRNHPDVVPNPTVAFANFFSQAIWVYIRRANIFEQTVSKYTAEALQVWDIPEIHDGFNAGMDFDVDLARDYMANFIDEDAQWLEFFKQNGITPIQIYYEDAVPNFPNYLAPVLAAAGLEINMAKLRPRRKQKVANDRSAVLAGVLENMIQRDLISHLMRR